MWMKNWWGTEGVSGHVKGEEASQYGAATHSWGSFTNTESTPARVLLWFHVMETLFLDQEELKFVLSCSQSDALCSWKNLKANYCQCPWAVVWAQSKGRRQAAVSRDIPSSALLSFLISVLLHSWVFIKRKCSHNSVKKYHFKIKTCDSLQKKKKVVMHLIFSKCNTEFWLGLKTAFMF